MRHAADAARARDKRVMIAPAWHRTARGGEGLSLELELGAGASGALEAPARRCCRSPPVEACVGSAGAEAGVGVELGEQGQLQHALLCERKRVEQGADLVLGVGLEEEDGAGGVLPPPDGAEGSLGVELADALALGLDQFRGERLGWEGVGAAAAEGEKLHEGSLENA